MIRPTADGSQQGRMSTAIGFVYIGSTALTVIGGATRRSYHFDHPGCRLEVHPRDAPGFVSIPTLRRVP
jgi:hypothetical protein